jgi:hypothetical protein
MDIWRKKDIADPVTPYHFIYYLRFHHCPVLRHIVIDETLVGGKREIDEPRNNTTIFRRVERGGKETVVPPFLPIIVSHPTAGAPPG